MDYEITSPDGNRFVVTAPEGATEADVLSYAQQNFGKAESRATTSGRQMPSPAQGAINALQGPTFGFLDELAGIGSGVTGAIANLTPWGDNKSFDENYRSGRDTVRGATQQFRQERPMTALGTSLLASAPTMALPTGAVGNAVVGAGQSALQAGKVGALYGGVSGAGESTKDGLGLLRDTAVGAAQGGAFGVGGQAAGGAVLKMGDNVAQRIFEASAAASARLKLAEQIAKDARGTAFTSGSSSPIAQVQARLLKLGPEATILDAAGASTRQLADTLASLPGRAKDSIEALIHSRQAGRAGRIVGAADEALGTNGRAYTATLEALDSAKKADAKPFYDALKDLSVRADPELNALLQAAEKAHGGAETLAKLRQELPIDLSKLKPGDDVPFAALDRVKQSLYDLAQSSKGEFGKATNISSAYDALRVRLTQKMDALSPKNADGSIYAQARNAYAGPSQLSDAVMAGRGAMKTDALAVADLTKGMGAGEMEAFRVGALQAIRDKVGTEAGQTSILKMWKEPATSDKLREIFGNNYRAFAAEVAKEARLKLMESTGRGSQTAARLNGAVDLDALGAAGNLAAGVATSNPSRALAATANLWNKVQTPETVRNELARGLLMRGPQAQNELQALEANLRSVNEARLRRSNLAGALAGQAEKP